MSLYRFDDKTHTYWLGISRIPSVTEVVSAITAPFYSDFPTEIRDKAAKRGSLVHKRISAFIDLKSGRELQVFNVLDWEPEAREMYNAFVEWWMQSEEQNNDNYSEIVLTTPYLCGTCDLLSLSKDGKEATIVDFKTKSAGSKHKNEELNYLIWWLQLNLYRQLLIMSDDKFKKIEKWTLKILCLYSDGTFSEKNIKI